MPRRDRDDSGLALDPREPALLSRSVRTHRWSPTIVGPSAPGVHDAGSGLRKSHLPAYLGGLKLGADAFLPAVLQAAAKPICVVDANGRIRFANSAAIAALGCDDARELLGRPCHEALHGTPADRSPRPASEWPPPAQTSGETVTRELDWFRRRDGSMFPVAYLSVPLDMPGGTGALVAFIDTRAPLRADRKREREVRLAQEQDSLRRVATLVAEGAMPAEVFGAVAREVAAVMHLPMASVGRYDDDGAAVTVVGAGGDRPGLFQAGRRWPLDGPSIAERVLRTGRPARFEDYTDIPGTIAAACRGIGFQVGVGAPIVVDGELWGLVGAGADQRELVPPDAERRLSRFTALVAAAIANMQAREDLRRLAGEQAALRRLATLVARAAEPQVVFDAVCEETGRLLGVSSVHLARYLSDGVAHAVAGWSERDDPARTGRRPSPEGDVVMTLVRDSAAPGRFESDGSAPRAPTDVARRLGVHSSAGAPVVVGGRVWGALLATSTGPDRLPAATEHRLASFADLVATAVSNAAARSELIASRVRIVEAADEQRRRVVRDLHDGAQERMIHAIFALQRAHDRDDAPPDVRSLVEEGVTHVRSAIRELRELAHGIHPEILTQHGLAAAVQPLADRAPLPVDIEMPEERYSAPVESAAYFVAAEALTNVAKYARASTARIAGTRTAAGLSLVVEDDGVGGAKRVPGRGLAGLGDRLAALDGALAVDSPPGGGTRIRAEIPLGGGASPTPGSGRPE
jgi:PAS domain S-box-containing protein